MGESVDPSRTTSRVPDDKRHQQWCLLSLLSADLPKSADQFIGATCKAGWPCRRSCQADRGIPRRRACRPDTWKIRSPWRCRGPLASRRWPHRRTPAARSCRSRPGWNRSRPPCMTPTGRHPEDGMLDQDMRGPQPTEGARGQGDRRGAGTGDRKICASIRGYGQMHACSPGSQCIPGTPQGHARTHAPSWRHRVAPHPWPSQGTPWAQMPAQVPAKQKPVPQPPPHGPHGPPDTGLQLVTPVESNSEPSVLPVLPVLLPGAPVSLCPPDVGVPVPVPVLVPSPMGGGDGLQARSRSRAEMERIMA